MGTTMFNLAEHHAFVQRHGDLVRWRRGIKCSCGSDPDGDRAFTTCVVCQGLGVRYAPESIIRALITGIRHDRSLYMSGIAQPGDLVIGFSPYEKTVVGPLDVFVLTRPDGEPYEGDIVKRRADGTMVDVLRYPPTVVQEITAVNPLSGEITTYPASSYSISGRLLTWKSGEPQPAPGSIYTASYFPVFEWIPFVIPMERFEQGINLGQRATLRKRHLVQRT